MRHNHAASSTQMQASPVTYRSRGATQRHDSANLTVRCPIWRNRCPARCGDRVRIEVGWGGERVRRMLDRLHGPNAMQPANGPIPACQLAGCPRSPNQLTNRSDPFGQPCQLIVVWFVSSLKNPRCLHRESQSFRSTDRSGDHWPFQVITNVAIFQILRSAHHDRWPAKTPIWRSCNVPVMVPSITLSN